MAAGGFKYYQGQTSHFYTPTTADILKDFQRSDQVFSLRRHYGHSNKNCSFDPVSVKGFGCLSKTCFDAFGLQK
jgi:hypothetical protein